MSRSKWTLAWLTTLGLAFLGGFGPTWWRLHQLEARVEPLERELELAHVENRIGSAFADAGHGNYERARRTMTRVFSTLQTRVGDIDDPAARTELQAVLDQRDAIITSLSRAEPDSAAKLLALHARCQAALDADDRPVAGSPSSVSNEHKGPLP